MAIKSDMFSPAAIDGSAARAALLLCKCVRLDDGVRSLPMRELTGLMEALSALLPLVSAALQARSASHLQRHFRRRAAGSRSTCAALFDAVIIRC